MRSAARVAVRTTQGSKPEESSSYRTVIRWLINWVQKVTDKRYRRVTDQRYRRAQPMRQLAIAPVEQSDAVGGSAGEGHRRRLERASIIKKIVPEPATLALARCLVTRDRRRRKSPLSQGPASASFFFRGEILTSVCRRPLQKPFYRSPRVLLRRFNGGSHVQSRSPAWRTIRNRWL